MARIAIQTALWKSFADLPRVVQSLRDQTVRDWKLYACENSCDPAEAERVKTFFAQSNIPYELVVNEKNLGFADGHNQLFAMHDSEFVLLLNDDSFLEPNYLEACLARFAAESSCASVTGPVYRWTALGNESQTRQDTTLIDTLGLKYSSLISIADIGAGESYGAWKDRVTSPYQVWGVSGAVAMFRRSHILAASPEQLMFAPTFFMYKEDVELAIRLRRKGFTAWFEPGAISFHRRAIKEQPKGLMNRLKEERRRPPHLRVAMYRNSWRVYIYHLSFALGAHDLFAIIAKEFLRSVGVFLASPSVFFRAWKEIFVDLPRAFRRRRALKRLGLKNISLSSF
jgi:GT2 family glycosyltransferase